MVEQHHTVGCAQLESIAVEVDHQGIAARGEVASTAKVVTNRHRDVGCVIVGYQRRVVDQAAGARAAARAWVWVATAADCAAAPSPSATTSAAARSWYGTLDLQRDAQVAVLPVCDRDDVGQSYGGATASVDLQAGLQDTAARGNVLVGEVASLKKLGVAIDLRQQAGGAGELVAAVIDGSQPVGIEDAILRGATLEVIGVTAAAAVEVVAVGQPRGNDQGIVAVVAPDVVAARAAGDHIVAIAAFDVVAPVHAKDGVITVAAEQEFVGSVDARQRLSTAVANDVVTRAPAEDHMLFASAAARGAPFDLRTSSEIVEANCPGNRGVVDDARIRDVGCAERIQVLCAGRQVGRREVEAATVLGIGLDSAVFDVGLPLRIGGSVNGAQGLSRRRRGVGIVQAQREGGAGGQ